MRCVFYAVAFAAMFVMVTAMPAVDSDIIDDSENVHEMILRVNEMHEMQRRAADANGNVDDQINHINEDEDDLDLFEGDIKVAPDDDNNKDKRSAITSRMWGTTVPYEITSSLSSVKHKIEKALKELQAKTCITFRPKRSGDQYWLKYVKKSGCYSYIGMVIKGGQDVSIGSRCDHHGIIIHETMHALGFHHEQSRPDRDSHVKILFQNIQKGRENNFKKSTSTSTQGLDYDFGSVMHYSKTAFTTNGKPTILAIKNPNQSFGQRNGPSDLDITGINIMYKCPNVGQITNWSQWSDCNAQCKRTRERFCKDKTKCPNANANGIDTETKDCTKAECYPKIDGNWGQWSGYAACSVTCGMGTKSRTRKCDNPSPKNGGAACKGDSTMKSACSAGSCNRGPYDVDFETGLGVWKLSGQQKWRINKGATRSCSTGPSRDATSGTGNYLYYETSCPARTGQKAELKAAVKIDRDCTLSFKYHMYGSSMGKLQVYVGARKAFEMSGNKGNKWLDGIVQLKKGDSEIKFVGIRGSSYRSDMALDDIAVQCGNTKPGPTTTPLPRTPGPVTRTPAPTTPGPVTKPPTPSQWGRCVKISVDAAGKLSAVKC